MPDVVVRRLPERTVAALKTRASLHNRSLEAEIRDILDEVARDVERRAAIAQIDAFRERISASGRVFSDSTLLIREDRDR